jgi:membrane protease YdiL (CAAX protease family)
MNEDEPYQFEPAPPPEPVEPPAVLPEAPLEPAIERYPFWTYFDLAVFAGLALPCILLGFGVVKLLFLAVRFRPENKLLELLPGQALGYVLLFGVLCAIFRMYHRPFWRSLAWTRPRIPLPLIVSAGMGAALIVAIVGNLIQTPNTENPMTELLKGRLSLVLMAIFGVTIGPLCEELAFRGFLQPLLVRSFGPVVGIFGAAIPFGLLHFQEYGNSWKHALLISLAGAAFGWMRQATGSTMASTVMHSAYNALFFIVFLSVKGGGK